MRRLVAVLLGALLVIAVAGPMSASADDTGVDNTAIAVNTKDGSNLFKLSFSISRVMSDSVTSTNAAVAIASCTDCQTTAVAIQFVLLMSDPSTFSPTNLALAENIDCTLCDTLASAYQYVIQAGGPVHLTAGGMQQLEQIRRDLLALKTSGLDSFDLQARIDELVKQAYQVLSTSLVAAAPPADASASTSSTTATTGSTDSTTSTTTSSSTTSSTTSTTGSSDSTSSTESSTRTTTTSAP
jgi:putative peptide zinc metalloprotease protein